MSPIRPPESRRPRSRYFDEVDTLNGSPEADTFEVEPLKYFAPRLVEDDTREAGQGRVIRKPGQGTAPPKEQPETTEMVVLNGGGEWRCFINGCVWVPNEKSLDDGTVNEKSLDDGPAVEKVDILVYQEKERDYYLEGFQAPTARSYTYIDDFEPIEDEIIVGGKPYVIEIGDNDIPMFAQRYIEDDCEWLFLPWEC